MIQTSDYSNLRREVVEEVVIALALSATMTWAVIKGPKFLRGTVGLPMSIGRPVLYVLLAVLLLKCAASVYGSATVYLDQRRKERHARSKARAPLRQEIRWWIAYLDNEWSWLLDTTEEQQQEWATRRFRELVAQWPQDHRRFETLFQNEEFPIAMQEEGPAATRMLKIWHLRTSLYKWARLNVTPLDRVALTLETAHDINLKKLEAGKALQDVTKENPDLLLFPSDEREQEAAT